MNIVLDASAVIAFLRGEPGGEVVQSYVSRRSDTLFIHAINLCEIYYDFMRAFDESSAETAVTDLFRLGVRERDDLDAGFWRAVAKLKAEHRRVSVADCCAVPLAQRAGATLLSADRHELEPLARGSVCSVEFIR